VQQELLLSYAVNIVAAIAIVIIGDRGAFVSPLTA
jgi:hypothetical protein